MLTDIIIYHNPACGTSRNVVAMIRAAGIEPRIVEYLIDPPSRETLVELIGRAGLTPRDLLRAKEPLASELGLADADDATILDAMVAHPILVNRPLVVAPLGVRLCRPSDTVLALLPEPEDAAPQPLQS